MIIDCISDLHGFHPVLEGGDLLIVAGDLTSRDEVVEHLQFINWLKVQDYRFKIVISGNHDGFYYNETHETKYISQNGIYLCDSGCEFEGLKIWGSPWTPEFYNWHFMKPRGAEIRAMWDKIPEDTDILITHGPPYGVLDSTNTKTRKGKEPLGCADLRKAVERVKPKLHVFGHIHGGYGQMHLKHHDAMKTHTICVNCAQMDERYRPVNHPIRINL